MHLQKSFSANEYGKLYLVPTPIGNLEDMTFRAVNQLKAVQLILAEDTRHTIKLLNHFYIDTPMQSFHEHSSNAQVEKYIAMLLQGTDIALVSDAGMPLINDPGHPLVQAALMQKISVVALPGANAALTALVASGLPAERFTYYGFFPRELKGQKQVLALIGERAETAIFYESPYRVAKSIAVMMKYLHQDTQVVVARELTKQYEEYLRGTLIQVNEWVAEHDIKGECVLLIEGGRALESSSDKITDQSLSLREQVTQYMQTYQVSSKEAIKEIAKLNQIRKQIVYQEYHETD
ncbi:MULTISPECIES: 16S rRNA (cytidine(1402)-2'-O)-methyltransferase [unclassified Facklamia]|uniref:16S rRNA (cytidine(1402)-2'-O)-methyltransferase n=1 Tax=Aerococcaceae TaxID=186827 RepID=UPI0013BA6CEA|nr:16S rRNA (cytidine(1402)-2'-O)-methyltransferase [Facklamia sp. 252]NEW68657.1 16S rRNA (cytidine(1402)-2'-O)-methyltransferase [Facklamia sp. 253]QQD65523.1 16S rRNA (cytidine(1402)-2'-O)-methyltransferase [Aerococcaceae bacterium zg-252]